LRLVLVGLDVALEASKRTQHLWVVGCCLDCLVVAFFRLVVPLTEQLIIKRTILVNVKPPLGVEPR
jgi:hypothetical protein